MHIHKWQLEICLRTIRSDSSSGHSLRVCFFAVSLCLFIDNICNSNLFSPRVISQFVVRGAVIKSIFVRYICVDFCHFCRDVYIVCFSSALNIILHLFLWHFQITLKKSHQCKKEKTLKNKQNNWKKLVTFMKAKSHSNKRNDESIPQPVRLKMIPWKLSRLRVWETMLSIGTGLWCTIVVSIPFLYHHRIF